MAEPKFIVRMDARTDMTGHPNVLYGLEQCDPPQQQREIVYAFCSSMYPMTLAELADMFQRAADKFRKRAAEVAAEEAAVDDIFAGPVAGQA